MERVEITPDKFIAEMEELIKKMMLENFDITDNIKVKLLVEMTPPEDMIGKIVDFYFIVYQNEKHVMFGSINIDENNMSIDITPLLIDDAMLLRKEMNNDIITFQ
ncbi:MAG: hypothetical protein QXW71_05380 [Thermoplasmata archaeon]